MKLTYNKYIVDRISWRDSNNKQIAYMFENMLTLFIQFPDTVLASLSGKPAKAITDRLDVDPTATILTVDKVKNHTLLVFDKCPLLPPMQGYIKMKNL